MRRSESMTARAMRGEHHRRPCLMHHILIITGALASTLEALVLVGPKRGFSIPRTGQVVLVTRRNELFRNDGEVCLIHPPSRSSRRPFVVNLSARSVEKEGGFGDVRGGGNGTVASRTAAARLDEEVGSRSPNTDGSTSTAAPQDGDDPPFVHHVAIQTANITRTIDFYSLFGYDVSCRFRAGPARAAWLELGRRRRGSGPEVGSDSAPPPTAGCRLELIEVPAYLFGPPSPAPSDNATTQLGPPVRRFRAVDAFSRPTYLGYHHVALDVTTQVRNLPQSTPRASGEEGRAASSIGSGLRSWIERLNSTSVERFGKSVLVALSPKQQIIGTSVYELAFVYDDSGCLVELLNCVSQRNRPIDSGWEPWDGKGFSGTTS